MNGSALIGVVVVFIICGITLKILLGMGIKAVKSPFSIKGGACLLALLCIGVYFLPEVSEAMARIP